MLQKRREEGGAEGTPEGRCSRGIRQRDPPPGALHCVWGQWGPQVRGVPVAGSWRPGRALRASGREGVKEVRAGADVHVTPALA